MRGKQGNHDLSAVSWLADTQLRESVRGALADEEDYEAVKNTIARCQAARKALQLKTGEGDYAVMEALYYRRQKLRAAQAAAREEAQRAREEQRAAIRAEEVAEGASLLLPCGIRSGRVIPLASISRKRVLLRTKLDSTQADGEGRNFPGGRADAQRRVFVRLRGRRLSARRRRPDPRR